MHSGATTPVAPRRPRAWGGEDKPANSGCARRRTGTIARCTPMPRPWISRTSRKPRACAARRYSSTTEGTSRGRKECRSSASSIGRRTGSSSLRLQAGAAHHVLPPVLVAQEILPCKLALSERGGALEEGHVDHAER